MINMNEYNNACSKSYDIYDKLVIDAMDTDNNNKKDKITKQVSIDTLV